MRVYYAHCMALYDTHQERRDLTMLLDAFGPNTIIVNPNSEGIEIRAAAVRAEGGDVMALFRDYIEHSDVVVFRALPDSGRISAGVAQELTWARQMGKPILEFPTALARRRMGEAETREYLLEVGQR